jgi:hypothetical protein
LPPSRATTTGPPAASSRPTPNEAPGDPSRSETGRSELGSSPAFKLLEEKDASLPLAKSWVAATLLKISQVEGKIERFKVYTAADIAFFSSIETHFKVKIPNVSESVARDRLLKIKQMYIKIQKVLTVIGLESTSSVKRRYD